MLELRKSRMVSAGVAELIKTLKPRKKGPIDRGKQKMNKIESSVLRSNLALPSQ